MSGLASTTTRGRQAIRRQREIANRCGDAWRVTPISTPDGTAVIDALFMCERRRCVLGAIAEIKARDMTSADVVAFGSYLITADKLDHGRHLAACLGVPYLLIVGLFPERTIVWWKIADAAGDWSAPFTRAQTSTQATCNGGAIVRENAYVSLTHMRPLKRLPRPTPRTFPLFDEADR